MSDDDLEQAEAAFRDRNWDLAIERYELWLQRDPRHLEARANLARCYAVRGMLERAVQQYVTLMDLLSPEDALELADHILQLDPANEPAKRLFERHS